MEDRRHTRIPRPAVLGVLSASDLNSAAGRKRKAASPLKAIQESKRLATDPARAPTPPQLEVTWDEVAEELGWSVDDCLNQKVILKKDLKASKEILLVHVRRLRAVGWHLHTETQRISLDNTSLQSALQQEEEKHAEEMEQARTEAAELRESLEKQQAEIGDLTAQLSQEKGCSKDLRDLLQGAELRANEASKELKRCQEDLTKAKEQISELQQQVATQSELHQHAQKYCAQLQDYNGKLQSDSQALADSLRTVQDEKNQLLEQGATLKGSISALEAQVQSAQTALGAAEAARHGAAEDASRLRSNLEQVTKDWRAGQETITALQQELERFKECTGKNIEILEKEKAEKAALEGQTRIQAEVNSSLAEQLAAAQDAAAAAQALAEARGGDTAGLRQRVATLETAVAAAENRVQELEVVRRKLHNTILELKGNIRVFCRVRPWGPGMPEVALGEDGQPILQLATSGDLLGRGLELQVAASGGQAPARHNFAFDKVFGPSSQQEEVFEEITQLVQSALDGYKVCIFAYGQTGSGKTYTMLGTPEERGLIPRAMDQLFQAACELEGQGWTFDMKASMLEIYNEEIRDLLGKALPAGKKHNVVHDEKKGLTTVSFLEAVDCKNSGRVKALLERASRQRAVGATAANEQSSRSHMVFMLSISATNAATGQEVNGALNLIDLAGSERLKKSGAEGDRLKETQAINKSLSALGDVIAALGSKESGGHIPYRNSKLTWLLQNCLGGDAKTLMFVNVSPTVDAAAESLCSLRFAAKVNSTEIGTARRNVAAQK